MKAILAIFLGGGLGSVSRYLVGRGMMALIPSSFPFGTLAANLISCCVLAIAVSMVAKEELTGFWIPFIVVGFCGGFSTFSTFSYETLLLMSQGKWVWASLNVAISIVSCIIILYYLSKHFS